MRKSSIQFLFLFGFSFVVSAQEYDDLYFTSSDRKKAKKERKKELQAELKFESSDNFSFNDEYSSTQVDPELIEKYEQQALDTRLQYQSSYNSTNQLSNPNYGEEPLGFQYSNNYNDGYYEDDGFYEDDGYYDDQGSTIINNYYGNNFRPGWRGNLGYRNGWSPYGWGNGWSISLGWGNGWNSYYCDPFYGIYDPWYYNSWNNGFAYNPYSFWGNSWYGYGFGNRRFRPVYGYGYGAYGGYHSSSYFAENAPSKRQTRSVTRGPRANRGGAVVSSNNGRTLGNRSSNLSDGRNYSRTQEEYLGRSRNSVGRSAPRATLGNRGGLVLDNRSNSPSLTNRNETVLNNGSRSNRLSRNRSSSSSEVRSEQNGNRNFGSTRSNSSTNRSGNVISSGQSSNRNFGSTRSKSNSNRSGLSTSRSNSNQNRNFGSRSSSRSGNIKSNSTRSSSSSFKPARSSSSSSRSGGSIRSSSSSSKSKSSKSRNRN